MYEPAQFMFRHTQYLVVVESQRGYFVKREPLCLGSIVSSNHVLKAHQGKIGYSDNTLTGIAVGCSKRMKLPNIGTCQTGFFPQFA